MKAYWGNGGINTHFLTSPLDGVSDQLHVPAALPPGKDPPSLDRKLSGPQSRSGLGFGSKTEEDGLWRKLQNHQLIACIFTEYC